MRYYLAKRILFFIPVIFLIVLFSFILLHYSPGDPIERIITGESIESINNSAITEQAKVLLRKELGLDLPLFYFNVSSLAEKQQVQNVNWKKYIPAISFHSNNQFHKWVFGSEKNGGLIRGDLGKSWVTTESIFNMILPKLGWSLLLTFVSVLFAYLISIPLGIKAALHPNAKGLKRLEKFFLLIYTLPAFWIASLLMLLLCNPEFLNILPSSGVGPAGGYDHKTGLIYKIIHTIPYLIIPTICYTYSSLAFLSNNVKVSMINVLNQDYIRTARAKGLTENKVIYKHALRNALLPMITIFAGIFPLAIGGSVILETVFTIPGMGLLVYQSISAQDYPVVVSVFMLTGIVTVISFLLSDIFYALSDPRISYTTK